MTLSCNTKGYSTQGITLTEFILRYFPDSSDSIRGKIKTWYYEGTDGHNDPDLLAEYVRYRLQFDVDPEPEAVHVGGIDWKKINSIPPGTYTRPPFEPFEKKVPFERIPYHVNVLNFEAFGRAKNDINQPYLDFVEDATLKIQLHEPKTSVSPNGSDFNFSTDITLNKNDFMIYGKGERPVYCQRPYVHGLAVDGSGEKIIFTTCETMGCPSCGRLWALQQVFKAAVHTEAYARYSGSRPAHGEASIDYDQPFTLDGIRKLRRNVNNRLKKQGVTAGLNLFHAFRIKPDVKDVLRVLLGSSDSMGFWRFLRDDDNISKINDVLGTDYSSYLDCVFLAPHPHFTCFPGDQKFTGDKDLLLKKNCFHRDGEKVWTLETSDAVVRYYTYMISHVSQLAYGKGTRFKPISPFGEMFKKSPEKLVSPEVLQEIRTEILEIMNQGRDKPLVLDDDTVSYSVPEEDEESVDFIPMSEFRLNSIEANERARDFESCVVASHPENLHYVRYLIGLYNMVHDSVFVPQKFKRLFLVPFEELPGSVALLEPSNQVRMLFEHGLKTPPVTFKLYINGFVSDEQTVPNR